MNYYDILIKGLGAFTPSPRSFYLRAVITDAMPVSNVPIAIIHCIMSFERLFLFFIPAYLPSDIIITYGVPYVNRKKENIYFISSFCIVGLALTKRTPPACDALSGGCLLVLIVITICRGSVVGRSFCSSIGINT